MLQKAIVTLNWNSHKINDYIQEVMSAVKELNHILETIKGNVSKTRRVLLEWEENLMINRKEGKTYELNEFAEMQQALQEQRNKKISEGAVQIAKFLSNSNKAVTIPRASHAWKMYTEYVNEIVMEGFSAAILASVAYLTEQVDPERASANEAGPSSRCASNSSRPRFGGRRGWPVRAGDGVRDHFNGWVSGFQNIGTLMKRLDIGEGDYTPSSRRISTSSTPCRRFNPSSCNEASRRVQGIVRKVRVPMAERSAASLHDFIEEHGTDGGSPADLFDAEIAKYKGVQEEIQSLPTTHVVGWIKIDAKPIKQALATWVTKWIFLFTQYLSNKVTNSMEELYCFRRSASGCWRRTPRGGGARRGGEEGAVGGAEEGAGGAAEAGAEGEGAEGEGAEGTKPVKKSAAQEKEETLYEVMGFMRDVRKRQDKTDVMFDPLVATVALLKTYDISVSEEVLKQLEEAPLAWSSRRRRCSTPAEAVADAAARGAQDPRDVRRVRRQG